MSAICRYGPICLASHAQAALMRAQGGFQLSYLLLGSFLSSIGQFEQIALRPCSEGFTSQLLGELGQKP